MSTTLTYTPGTLREAVLPLVPEDEAVAYVRDREPRSGELLVLEEAPGGLVTVVALTAGERCPTCGRAGR